jgi:hypothetical protein
VEVTETDTNGLGLRLESPKKHGSGAEEDTRWRRGSLKRIPSVSFVNSYLTKGMDAISVGRLDGRFPCLTDYYLTA